MNAPQTIKPSPSKYQQDTLTDSEVKYLKKFQKETIKETKRLLKEMELVELMKDKK